MIETKALRRSNVVKTTLLRSVSHDLRSPLTAIATAAGGIGSETLGDSERKELAAVIVEVSARLSTLVDNLLDLSRLESGAAEPRPTGARWTSSSRRRSTPTARGRARITTPPGEAAQATGASGPHASTSAVRRPAVSGAKRSLSTRRSNNS